MISGTSHRAWQHWEDGKRAVPGDVCARIRSIGEWRRRAIDTILAEIAAKTAEFGAPKIIPAVWYDNMRDWIGEPVMWRPHQSACAELVLRHQLVVLVPFDRENFAGWLGARADGLHQRAVWATQAKNADG